MKPLISVITPTYNSEAYLKEAIESVLNQNYSDFEHIIIDGNSTDNTEAICRRYEHLSIIREDDGGLYQAVNKGIEMAIGNLVFWLNSDDEVGNDIFHPVADIFLTNPNVEVICGSGVVFTEVDRNRKRLRRVLPFTSPDKFSKGIIDFKSQFINSCFFSKKFLSKVGKFDEKYKLSGDKEYLLRMACQKPDCESIEKITYFVRWHEKSLTFSDSAKQQSDWTVAVDGMEICENYMDKRESPIGVKNYCKFIYRTRRVKLILFYFRKGRYKSFSEQLINLLLEDPLFVTIYWHKVIDFILYNRTGVVGGRKWLWLR